MQPIIEKILEMTSSKDEDVRDYYIDLIEIIAGFHYSLRSYDERLKHYAGHIPDKYLAIYFFDDEWGKIAHFLSRLFIEDYSEAAHRVIYCLKSLGADALEPLLDILIEAPEKLNRETMIFNRGIYDVSQTLFELIVERVYKKPNPTGSALAYKRTKRETKKILNSKSPVPFFKRWAASDDPNTAEAGLSWLKRLKEDYGIVK